MMGRVEREGEEQSGGRGGGGQGVGRRDGRGEVMERRVGGGGREQQKGNGRGNLNVLGTGEHLECLEVGENLNAWEQRSF